MQWYSLRECSSEAVLANFSNCGFTQFFFWGRGKCKLSSKQLKLTLNVGYDCDPLVDSGLCRCNLSKFALQFFHGLYFAVLQTTGQIALGILGVDNQ